MSDSLIMLSAIALVAYTVRGATGAASAIVANAVLALVVALGGGDVATLRAGLYWLAMADLVASAAMFIVMRSGLSFEPIVVRFLLFSLPVNVVFTLVLPGLSLPILGLALGIALLLTGGLLVYRPAPALVPVDTLRRYAAPAGALGGVLGGLFGMAGPVAMLFFSRASADPALFRRRVTSLSVVTSSTRVVVLAASGAIDLAAVSNLAATVPAIALGLVLGFRIHRALRPTWFWSGLGGVVGLAGLLTVGRVLLLDL